MIIVAILKKLIEIHNMLLAVHTDLLVCLMFVLIVLIKIMMYVGIWSFVT